MTVKPSFRCEIYREISILVAEISVVETEISVTRLAYLNSHMNTSNFLSFTMEARVNPNLGNLAIPATEHI